MDMLKKIKTPYIDAQTLVSLFSDYAKPREKILRLIKNKQLIRLKNGFYVIQERIENTNPPYEQIANLLYGPSYVSLEWVLSFYGIIPERVPVVTSATLSRNKQYITPIGTFTYSHLPSLPYSVGVEQKKAVDTIGGFLIATAEKALADFVFLNCRGMNREQLLVDLLESRRMDHEALKSLNKGLLLEISSVYQSKIVSIMSDLIGVL